MESKTSKDGKITMMYENKSCKICSSQLNIESRCKLCNKPTRLFCHTCGIMAEVAMHPACMIIDVNKMLLETRSE